MHAIVVLTDGKQATVEELRTHVKALIAGYKAPKTIEFAETLPTSAAGKILKRERRARYRTPGGKTAEAKTTSGL
ncbi:hypothetical protein Atai01_81420 [Amycolatopsis taiwanensis]|uniref:AMP-binding enzyme C-terminal domain-containing protein n=1 Tax=Amycolatopsis taiwanensis TaxID=342230 RepID=A0A9W6R943_9PSEU|nr:hypothetical protein Atai01_81420 [Amycolatopsis taiwanensis]